MQIKTCVRVSLPTISFDLSPQRCLDAYGIAQHWNEIASSPPKLLQSKRKTGQIWKQREEGKYDIGY